jgi:hypothetical protein
VDACVFVYLTVLKLAWVDGWMLLCWLVDAKVPLPSHALALVVDACTHVRQSRLAFP